MNDDPYDYYDYQMSGALDAKYTGALSDDKAKSFNLEYYLDGLRSIVGNGNFSMQDLSCVYSRLSEAFHPIRDEILANKYDKSLDSLYSRLSYKMDETFVSVAGKVNKIKPHMLADWFEEELGTLRQEVDMIGLMNGGHVTKRDDDAVIVRDAVAKQGYGLDILIDDDNRDVRMTVAHRGYGLDKLIDGDYWGVRAEIANQGYGLDKLIHDEEPKVRLLAYDALRAEEEQQKSNQQGKRRVLFVQDNYDDEIENSEFDFDV